MSTTGAKGSTGAATDVVGDATAAATGAAPDPGSPAVSVVPRVAGLGGAVALDTWTQPVTRAATRASAAKNWESRDRVMRASVLPDLLQRSGDNPAAAFELVSGRMFDHSP